MKFNINFKIVIFTFIMLIMFDSVLGENVALSSNGATASATSTYGIYTSSKLIDGIKTGGWSAGWLARDNEPYPINLTVTLANVTKIDKIVVVQTDKSSYTTKNYDLYYSTDNINWNFLKSDVLPHVNHYEQSVSFNTVSAKYIKMVITDGYRDLSYDSAGLAELEIYRHNLSENLVSYYSFDSNTNDDYGSNDAINFGATYNSIGKINGAYTFDGVNDYMTLNKTWSNVGINDALSLVAWIKPSDVSTQRQIISDENYILGFNINGKNFVCNRHAFSSYPSVSISGNQWYFLVCTQSNISASANNVIKSYKNGAYVSSATQNNSALGINYIINIGSDTGTRLFYKGDLDEVAFFNRVLNSYDINEMYNKTMQGYSYFSNGFLDSDSCNVDNDCLSGYCNWNNVCIKDSVTFTNYGSTTNFSQSPGNLNNPILDNTYFKIVWNGNNLDFRGANFTKNIVFGSKFLSLNSSDLPSDVNSTANVTLQNVSCNAFNLYYADSFVTDLPSIVAQNNLVATQDNLGGDCVDTSICTNVQCSGDVLTFTAKHFDGFGAGEGSVTAVPEFNTWTIMLIVGLIGMFFYYRR